MMTEQELTAIEARAAGAIEHPLAAQNVYGAHYRTDIPALCAEVRELQRENCSYWGLLGERENDLKWAKEREARAQEEVRRLREALERIKVQDTHSAKSFGPCAAIAREALGVPDA